MDRLIEVRETILRDVYKRQELRDKLIELKKQLQDMEG